MYLYDFQALESVACLHIVISGAWQVPRRTVVRLGIRRMCMFLTWLAMFLLFTRVTTEPPRVLSCCIFLFCNHLIFSLTSSISCSVARLRRVYSSMCDRRVPRLFFKPESSIIRLCRSEHDINIFGSSSRRVCLFSSFKNEMSVWYYVMWLLRKGCLVERTKNSK